MKAQFFDEEQEETVDKQSEIEYNSYTSDGKYFFVKRLAVSNFCSEALTF